MTQEQKKLGWVTHVFHGHATCIDLRENDTLYFVECTEDYVNKKPGEIHAIGIHGEENPDQKAVARKFIKALDDGQINPYGSQTTKIKAILKSVL